MDFNKVVDVERCHIATDGINEALPSAREAARKRVSDAYAADSKQRIARHGATLLFRETSENGCVTDNKADVSENVNGMVFDFKVRWIRLTSFFLSRFSTEYSGPFRA